MASHAWPVPVAPLAGKKQERATFLKLLVSNYLSPFLRRHIKYAPRTSHTNHLGNLEAFAEAPPKGTALELTVGDGTGEYALSEVAGRHWLELGVAALSADSLGDDFARWIQAFGYELTKPGDIKALLKKSKLPLVEVPWEGKPYLVAVAGAKKIVTDVDFGPPSFAALDPKGVAAVARVAKSKVCECFCCVSLRKKFRVGG